MSNFKNVKFEDSIDFVNDVVSLFEQNIKYNDFFDIAIYAKYEQARHVLEDLFGIYCFPISLGLNLETPEWAGYDKEFVIYLGKDGVSCEKVYLPETGHYIDGGGSIAFVHGDCSSALLKKTSSDVIIQFDFEDDEYDCDTCEFCGDCDHAEKHEDETCECDEDTELGNHESRSVSIHKDDDGNPEGFTKSWTLNKGGIYSTGSYSYWSSDIDSVKRMAGKFDIEI